MQSGRVFFNVVSANSQSGRDSCAMATDDSAIASLEAQVKELEMTEAQLLPAVRQLEACRQLLRRKRTSLAHLRNRKAHISRLPDEVLSLIFEAGPRDDPTDGLSEDSADGRPLPFAVLVTHISRTWRDVAIRNPFLWTKIIILYSRSHSLNHLYLDRSKPCSLYIDFTCDMESADDFDPFILQLHRCSHLAISCHSYQSALHIFQRIEKEASPRLLSLKINVEEVIDGDPEDFLPVEHKLLGGGAPSLSSMELRGTNLWSCKPPLGSLTNLKLDSSSLDVVMTFHQFWEVFSAIATKLTHLELEGVLFRAESGDQLLPIVFPSLLSLYMDCHLSGIDHENYISNLWDCIHVPALQSLSLHYLTGREFDAVMSSLRHQTGAKAGLTSLSLVFTDIDDYAGDFALACPYVSELNLVGTKNKPILKFILNNASNVDTGLLWPNLRILSVSSWGGNGDEILRALYLARKGAGHPLAQLRFEGQTKDVAWFHQTAETVPSSYSITI